MSLVDAGMVPFQKAYVMICKWESALRRMYINPVTLKFS